MTLACGMELEIWHENVCHSAGIYILAIPPSPGGDFFCPNWKTGNNLKEDLKKGKEKGEKEENKEKSDKTHVKYLYES